MSRPPNPKPSKARILLFAMIPGGFLLLVAVLIFTGFWTQEVTDTGGTMDQPAPVELPTPTDPATQVPPHASPPD